jgi:Bacteriophage protein of unknown function (DUF646).
MGVKVDFSQFEALKVRLQKLEKTEQEQFLLKMTNKLTARAQAKTKKRTPVRTGDLRRNWYQQKARKLGRIFIGKIFNPMDYASYVNYGHRTRNNEGWVEGQHMMDKSLKEVENDMVKIIQPELEKLLNGVLNGK